MTRRLTLAIVGAVAATLLLAGIGTLALARIGSRAAARADLEEQAETVAGLLDLGTIGLQARIVSEGETESVREALRQIVAALDLRDIALVLVDGDGGLAPISEQLAATGLGDLPSGVAPTAAELGRVADGETVGGTAGDVVWAAAAVAPSDVGSGRIRPGSLRERFGVTPVIVLTSTPETTVGPAARWFLVASGLTIVLGAGLALGLGRSLTRPLREATAATGRIAAGDLGTRLTASADDEVGDLARSINEMAASLERARGLEQQFLLSISHDLRTPLTSIGGWAEAIADGTADDPAAAAAVIRQAAARLERLVGDLLDLAKLDAQGFALDLVPTDPGPRAEAAADALRPAAGAAGIAVAVRHEATAPVAVDPDRFDQVLANLLENALKYASTTVEVTVAVHDGLVEVVVADDGPGIAPQDLPHVFERLYVAQRSPLRSESGSGIGLAIVRELVSAMGGTVTATARDGGGTAMIVRLPAVDGRPAG